MGRARLVAVKIEVAVNVLLPYAVYSLAHARWSDVHALMAASAAPAVWGLVEFARHRRVDALSLLVLGGIALSLLAMLGGGGVRVLQLREQLVIAAVGLIFLASAAAGQPLIHRLARARMHRAAPEKAHAFQVLAEHPIFRRATMVMTLAWGIAMLAEAALAGALAFVLPIGEYLIVGPVIGYSTLAALTAWTWRYAARRVGAARAANVPA